jgi:MFS family permease
MTPNKDFKTSRNYRWFVVAIFFIFMLLHQIDRLLIGPLTGNIIDEFKLTNTQMGLVTTMALLVATIFYPVWGYLFDRYARSKVLALASFIWGSTTWLSAIAPTYPLFAASRASTGVDDASYPGLYSLVTDYFGPKVRGKVYGLLQLTAPIGYMLGIILALVFSNTIGWRGVFFATGTLGVLVAILMFFGLRDAPRGQSEPEMEGRVVHESADTGFSWAKVREVVRKPSLILIYVQGFFGVFPWNAITYWFFIYLERERGYGEGDILVVMGLAVFALAAGYPIGGALGDYFFRKIPGGRAYVSSIGILVGAILFALTLNLSYEARVPFLIMMTITALFIPIAATNVIGTVYDVTIPEVRSTALAIENFLENIGAALSPLLVGIIADAANYQTAFLWICTSTWLIGGVTMFLAARRIPADAQVLRHEMQRRASQMKIDK